MFLLLTERKLTEHLIKKGQNISLSLSLSLGSNVRAHINEHNECPVRRCPDDSGSRSPRRRRRRGPRPLCLGDLASSPSDILSLVLSHSCDAIGWLARERSWFVFFCTVFRLLGNCGVEAATLGTVRDTSSSYTSLISDAARPERRLVGVLVREGMMSLPSPGSSSVLPLVCSSERERTICREARLRVPSLRELDRKERLTSLPRPDSISSFANSSSPQKDSVTAPTASSITRACL